MWHPTPTPTALQRYCQNAKTGANERPNSLHTLTEDILDNTNAPNFPGCLQLYVELGGSLK